MVVRGFDDGVIDVHNFCSASLNGELPASQRCHAPSLCTLPVWDVLRLTPHLTRLLNELILLCIYLRRRLHLSDALRAARRFERCIASRMSLGTEAALDAPGVCVPLKFFFLAGYEQDIGEHLLVPARPTLLFVCAVSAVRVGRSLH